MQLPLEVSNTQAHREAMIRNAVIAIGRSAQKRQVFEAIYKHKTRSRTAETIASMTGLHETRVLQLGGQLRAAHIVGQEQINKRVAYVQVPFYQAYKKQILRALDRPVKVTSKPGEVSVSVKITGGGAHKKKVAQHLTIDEIDSFKKVRTIKGGADHLPKTMSEGDFKNGVQRIIGEPGNFKDWGGEQSDLFSSRVMMNGKRMRIAFAFKGPGLDKPLTPAGLGKNGDQIQRLLAEPADIYIVQHHREIRPSVLKELEAFANDKASGGKTVYYGIIDGRDSNRLRLAYPGKFKTKPKAKKAAVKKSAKRKKSLPRSLTSSDDTL